MLKNYSLDIQYGIIRSWYLAFSYRKLVIIKAGRVLERFFKYCEELLRYHSQWMFKKRTLFTYCVRCRKNYWEPQIISGGCGELRQSLRNLDIPKWALCGRRPGTSMCARACTLPQIYQDRETRHMHIAHKTLQTKDNTKMTKLVNEWLWNKLKLISHKFSRLWL